MFENFGLLFWHWWIVAGVLLMLELLSFTTFFLWTAIAAVVTGILKWCIPSMSWHAQFLLFAVWSVLSLLIWWRYARKGKVDKTHERLNQRSLQLVGQTCVLTTDLKNGTGHVKIGDSIWLAKSTHMALKGEAVKVVDVDGTVLLVEPLSAAEIH